MPKKPTVVCLGCGKPITVHLENLRASCENPKCAAYYETSFEYRVTELAPTSDGLSRQYHIDGTFVVKKIGSHGHNESVTPEWDNIKPREEVTTSP